jgi:hypothetical protein
MPDVHCAPVRSPFLYAAAVVGLVVGTTLLQATSPSRAASGDRTVMSWGALPAGVTAVQLGTCQDPFGTPAEPAFESSQRISTARGDSPLGDDAFELSPIAWGGLLFNVDGLDELAVLAVSTLGGYNGGGLSYGRAAVDLVVGGHRWRLTSYLQQPQLGWHRHDLTYFKWDDLDSTSEPDESGTAAEFASAHGDASAQVRILATECGDTSQIDGLSWGPTGDATTYDVEQLNTWASIVPQGSLAQVARGRAVVGCGLLVNDVFTGLDPVVGRTFVLLARPYGAATFSEAGRGRERYKVRPATTTDYRCRFDGDAPDPDGPEHGPAISPIARVKVPHQLTITAEIRGQKVVVAGTTTPAHPGTSVRVTARGRGAEPLKASGKVRSDGSYRLVLRLDPGGWRLRATEDAAAGNTKGASRVRRVQIPI